ncbi:MAG: hypothetical protein ACTSUE_17350 [Promethearchaeota archaeon]
MSTPRNYATIHVGFLRNENKGTTKSHFIPPEYHEMMAQLEYQQGVDGETGMGHDDVAGSASLTFATHTEHHKARERYRQFTRAGPFSWTYNLVRDFIAGNMMKDWRFKHCEIAFDQNMFPRSALTPVNNIPYGPDCLVAFGTNMKDGEVFRKPRTFKPRGSRYSGTATASVIKEEEPYEWIHLRIDKDIVREVITLANQELGKEYDTKTLERMLVSPSSLKSSTMWDTQKWHCTNFTVHILQQAMFLNGMDPNCLTADDVYYFLKENKHESKVFTTPASAGKNSQRIRNEMNKLYS